jgi:hypothetical protein
MELEMHAQLRTHCRPPRSRSRRKVWATPRLLLNFPMNALDKSSDCHIKSAQACINVENVPTAHAFVLGAGQ